MNSEITNPQSEYEYRRKVYLRRKHEFETLGEDDNNDVLSREEKMNIAKAEMDKIANDDVYSADAVNTNLSPKEGDRVRMDHYMKLNYGQEGIVTGRIGELCWVTWDDGTKSKEIKGYLTVIERDGKVVNASVKAAPKTVKSAKDATFKNDKRLSTTSERYKGYLIVLDRGGDGYNVYDKHRELEDAGYPSKEAAKNFIDELVANDDVYSADDVDDIESEFQRIDRSGTDEEVAIAAIMYNLGTTMREAREILPTLSEDKIKDYVDYYYLRDLPTSERVKIWNKRKITSATNSEYALFKKTYSHSREFKDKDTQSGSIRDLIDELENKDISYEIYDNKTDNGCTVFYDDDGTVTAASYGGSFDIEDDQYSDWKELASKSVEDSDGFNTDYTLYTNGETYICMFGDKDLYEPDASYADYETENEENAWEWFNSYEGFSDDDDDIYSDDIYIDDIYSSEELDNESDELDHPDQEFDSAETSINSNKLPAVYRMISIPEGSIGLDFGGGRWDNAVEHIRDLGATLCVYDPYNRSAKHNKEVIKTLRANGGADWAINSNVLNVIKEPEARKAVLENISKITKSGAPIYITVYEGRGDGKEGQTKSGYQLNRKTQDYLEDIQEVFPDAKRKGKLITAHNIRSVNSSVNASDGGYVYTYCDECGKKNRVKVTFNNFNEPFNDTEYRCKYCGTRNMLTDPHEYDDEGYVISSATDLYSEEDDPAEFNSVEDYLKYNIEKGYIDWLSLPSEENDDFDDDDFDDDFYDIVYQIESAIAKVTHGGEYKICVPNQFEEENGAFCTVIANGKRYAVEGIGNNWIVSDGFADEEDEYDVDDYDEIYSANYGGAYYVEVNSTQRGTAPYEKKFSDFNSALSFAKKRGNSKTIIYIWDIPKEERSSNSVPNAVYDFDSGWQIIRPVSVNEDRADDEIYSSTTSSRGYWYFTRHGVQPGSVPKYVNILDIVDTPEGAYFLADGVIHTNDLRDYEIRERRPEGEIYSSKQSNSKLNQIRDKITKVVKNVMMFEAGFSEDEVEEYSVVAVDPSGKVEVRAEVDYDGLMSLCDALNPIVQRYDKDSYFEPVEPGIIEAYVDKKSITSASSTNNTYDKRMTVSRGGQKFSVYYNHVDNRPSADAHQMWLEFKATVSAIKPYDDAEYAWAQIENGHINVIKGGKVIQQYYYFDADDMDVENSEWCDSIIEQAIDYISEINDKVESRMVHNSTSTKGETIEAGYYDVPERNLDPPDYNEPTEEEPSIEYFDFYFDSVIIMHKDGGWDYENNDYSFAANPDDAQGNWYTDEDNIYVTDATGMVECFDDMIESMMPADPGRYRIQGYANMAFDITGVEAYYTYYRDESYDRELIDDSGKAKFNFNKSEIKDFKCTRIA